MPKEWILNQANMRWGLTKKTRVGPVSEEACHVFTGLQKIERTFDGSGGIPGGGKVAGVKGGGPRTLATTNLRRNTYDNKDSKEDCQD